MKKIFLVSLTSVCLFSFSNYEDRPEYHVCKTRNGVTTCYTGDAYTGKETLAKVQHDKPFNPWEVSIKNSDSLKLIETDDSVKKSKDSEKENILDTIKLYLRLK